MREVPGTQGCSGSKGSKLGVSWGISEAIGRSHGLEMLRGQGEQAAEQGE